jgi:PIN domain nuclease of toxin-antitoxin system
LRVLLDTHVLLWSLEEPTRIGAPAKAAFRDTVTEIVVSVVNFWEIAIKRRLGDLNAPDDLPDRVHRLGHRVLNVEEQHAWHVRSLPLYHGDPFDRLLVAQAQIEDLTLVTHDRILERYDVRIIRA